MEPLHRFTADIRIIEPPARFNNPFHYNPHQLCQIAADEVKNYISGRKDFATEVAEGKMFGVLVVRDACGCLGYLAAFSGLLCGSNVQEGFVPAVFDFLNPDGYFKREEGEISDINIRIAAICDSSDYKEALDRLEICRKQAESELALMREDNRLAKILRDEMRSEGNMTPEEEALLVRDSQYRKAELKRCTKMWSEKIAGAEALFNSVKSVVERLKEERKRRSASLQEWLFSQFVMLNARGESRTLLQIFAEQRGCIPPAGAGECAAPKLLQYAYKNSLQPICMAEFWLGASPVGEVRRDGCFYGSCKGKCEPILAFMLQGLDVEKSSLEEAGERFADIPVLYEDDWLIVVDKPSGMLSVPGKVGGRSVQEWLACHYDREDIFVAHRLDMSTSGILVAAKGIEAFKAMQSLFARRLVQKSYMALLSAVPKNKEGQISLPLLPDYMHRPRQMVDVANGKEAVTLYSIVSTCDNNGKVCAVAQLQPLTGRTHQLRVHCAHILGLGTPIVGDELYGLPDKRLMLHASQIAFEHPFTHKKVVLESAPDFLK
ncbi:MAG: RNA pseudouridine synthase [Bacteroidaceae bacterium]|nr:RNA pseudouridine synthase [Bacteroidaceae bacterium]